MPKSEDDFPLLIYTTLASEADAQSFVQHLVDRRLVACGTILHGARSIYRWKGQITNESEAFVILKSRHGRWAELQAEVRQEHPYDVPELIAVPATMGLPSYLQWIVDETRPDDVGTQ